MGGFHSRGDVPKQKQKTSKRMQMIETALLVKILKFDLNLETNPALTIESRFTRENTNDMGDALQPQTAQIIIMEFKKFMFLVALEILKNRKADRKNKYKRSIVDSGLGSSSNSTEVFESPFTAPPYLDRVWRLFILYNKNYEEFGNKICGGYIDRNDPREKVDISYEKYCSCIKFMQEKQDLIKPFFNLWPKYNGLSEYMTDFKYNGYVSSEGIPQVIQFMNSHGTEADNKTVEIEAGKELAKQGRDYYLISSPPVDNDVKIGYDDKVDHPYFGKKQLTPREALK